MELSQIINIINEKAGGSPPIDAKIKFNFGDGLVHIDGTGDSNVVSFEDKEADCSISISPENFAKLQSGDLNPMMAVMTGKIKIKGDMSVAMRLQSLIS